MRQDTDMALTGNRRSGIASGWTWLIGMLTGSRLLATFLLAFVLLGTASLAGHTGPFGMTSFGITAEAASLSKTSLTLLKGSSVRLKVTGASGPVTWASKKPKVASVSQNGVVTGKKRGRTVIVVKIGRKKLKCSVNVMYAGPVETADAVKGIDVSAWQGTINFQKVKKSGIRFVIIRIGHGTEVDSYFQSNYRKAKAAGLRVGGYWFSTALNKRQAAFQRNLCLKAIRGKSFDFPVFVDIEYLPQLKKGRKFTSVVIKDFCRAMKKNGFLAGFYTSRGFIGKFVSPSVARNYGYFQWIAEYSNKNRYGYSYNMWQYGAGRVSGVSTKCDLDFYFPSEKNSVG